MLPRLRNVLARTSTLHLYHTHNTRSFAMDSIKATVYENFGGT